MAGRREVGAGIAAWCLCPLRCGLWVPACLLLRLDPLSRQQDRRQGLAVPRQLLIGFAGTLHQRSHFNETDQVLASLRRKQRAFNPLISEN